MTPAQVDDSTPILIGAGQFTQRDADPAAAKEPLAMMVEVARRAAHDAGAGPKLLAQLDTIAVVSMIGWHYANAPRLLAEQLGAQPTREIYTTVGGNTPQWLVNETAAHIAAGRVRIALLAGAEAINTLLRARRAKVQLQWSSGGSGTPTVVGEGRSGSSDYEMNHGLHMPTMVYPLFENALRKHYGLSLDEHQARLGQLCSRFSAVAAANPYAWFQQQRSAAEIATVTPTNRIISFPYPKFMNAIIDVDQAAAVIMTSVGTARQLGIDPSRWIYLWGCGDAHDLWYVSERVNYHSSPAIRVAGQRALAMAGLGIADIEHFDLYSCFPCAVQIGRDMLGIAPDDERSLTITGGLPYHGGPGNNYVMHAIAAMMTTLRAEPSAKGLVSGLGWYITKHSVGIYSATPTPGLWGRQDPKQYQPALDAMPHPDLVLEANGPGVIETYTVVHDRDGTPMKGIIIGRLGDGRRFIANTSEDRPVLEGLMTREGIGVSGTVSHTNGLNRFEI